MRGPRRAPAVALLLTLCSGGAEAPGPRDADGQTSATSGDGGIGSAPDTLPADGDPGAACPLPQLADDPLLVATDRGAIRGTERGETLAFLGVPFAAPPVGPLRWRPTQPHGCWAGVRDAVEFPPICTQLPVKVGASAPQATTPMGQEDCLYLNVWRPRTLPADASLPVMVFIHGGGNVSGSSSKQTLGITLLDGQAMAERAQVVVVTLQYRLGWLGYLALAALSDESSHGSSGNYGLLDQIEALRWIQRNIDRFGGDAKRVMLFGESGGAVDVCMLLASPLAAGLFQRAAMQSGACVVRTLAERQAEGSQMVGQVGCTADDIDCLRALSAEKLVATTPALNEGGLVTQSFGSNVDGWVLPRAPLEAFAAGEHNRVALIVGSNADETAVMVLPGTVTPAKVKAAFLQLGVAHLPELLKLYPPGDSASSARQAYIRATSDAQFICQARRTARALAQGQSEPVYRYSFEHVASGSPTLAAYGAFHGLELFYLFQGLEHTPDYQFSAEDGIVAEQLLRYWTTLAREGSLAAAPAGGALAAWPAFGSDSEAYLRLTATPQAAQNLRAQPCDLWDEIQAP